MSFNCPYCRDTGRVTERGRLYGDRTIGRTCECQPREGIDHAEREKDRRDREYADDAMAMVLLDPNPEND